MSNRPDSSEPRDDPNPEDQRDSDAPVGEPEFHAEPHWNRKPLPKDFLEFGDPDYFLLPILAQDPLPHLRDGDGHPIDAQGRRVNGDSSRLPEGILKLQRILAREDERS